MTSESPIPAAARGAPLDACAVAAALPEALRAAFRIEVVATTGSTNSDLLARAARLPSGHVLAAERQLAGRGRRGRAWSSPPGASLAFSVLWRFALPAARLNGLSLAVGVAVARALEAAGARGVALKWPNDVLAMTPTGWGKLAGILIEIGPADAASSAVVIGIGLNVLPFAAPAGAGYGIADAAGSGAQADRDRLLAAILAQLHHACGVFAARGFTPLAAEWNALHAFHGSEVVLSSEGAADLRGVAAGVNGDGALILETPQGARQVVSGEVTLRA
jgi:BirA family biotin operon repressor/biotin-[acetyl-CoA-carboxylase] ligase